MDRCGSKTTSTEAVALLLVRLGHAPLCHGSECGPGYCVESWPGGFFLPAGVAASLPGTRSYSHHFSRSSPFASASCDCSDPSSLGGRVRLARIPSASLAEPETAARCRDDWPHLGRMALSSYSTG